MWFIQFIQADFFQDFKDNEVETRAKKLRCFLNIFSICARYMKLGQNLLRTMKFYKI